MESNYNVIWDLCYFLRLKKNVSEKLATVSYCNCNLFAVHKSKLGYSPVDIDFVTYMPCNIIYT